jgi:hypothetical protein
VLIELWWVSCWKSGKERPGTVMGAHIRWLPAEMEWYWMCYYFLLHLLLMMSADGM